MSVSPVGLLQMGSTYSIDIPDSSKQSSITFLLQRLDGLIRQRATCLLKSSISSLEIDEGELQSQ